MADSSAVHETKPISEFFLSFWTFSNSGLGFVDGAISGGLVGDGEREVFGGAICLGIAIEVSGTFRQER
jgi:hypothetical protein